MSILRLSKTSSLNGEVSSIFPNAAVAEMAALNATVTTTTADGVGSTAVLLDLVGGHTRESRTLQWIAEHDSTSDVGCRDTVGESVVDDHTALAVARDDDLGARALLECLLDVLGHDLSSISTHVHVTLNAMSALYLVVERQYLHQKKPHSRHPGR